MIRTPSHAHTGGVCWSWPAPERFVASMNSLRRYSPRRTIRAKSPPTYMPRYFGAELDDQSLTPGKNARLGSVRFEGLACRHPQVTGTAASHNEPDHSESWPDEELAPLRVQAPQREHKLMNKPPYACPGDFQVRPRRHRTTCQAPITVLAMRTWPRVLGTTAFRMALNHSGRDRPLETRPMHERRRAHDTTSSWPTTVRCQHMEGVGKIGLRSARFVRGC